jgi:LmbE family N-acetylglucosaminyl deacetylase
VWLYFTGGQHVNHFVDISETFEQKVAALAAHESQIGDWARSGGLRKEITKWAEEAAARHNLGFKYAETFQRIVLEGEESPEAAALEVQAE